MKARARDILDHASKEPGWVPAYARGDRELWTPKLVRHALVDAFRMLKRVGGKVGPAPLKAHWPEFRIDQADFVEQSLSGTLQAQQVPSRPEYRTRMTVTRMEMVLLGWKDADGVQQPAWMDGPLAAAPDLREVLRVAVFADLRGEPFKELCRQRGWVYTTQVTYRDRAAGIIAQRLNSAGIEIWI